MERGAVLLLIIIVQKTFHVDLEKPIIFNIISLIEKSDCGTVNIFDQKNIILNTKKAEAAYKRGCGVFISKSCIDDKEYFKRYES